MSSGMSSTPSIPNSGASTPSSSSQSNSQPSSAASSIVEEEFPYAISLDKRDLAAKSVHYQRLERALDLSSYMKQVEQVLAKPIKIPASHSHSINQKKTFFPIRGIWPTEEKRREKLSRLYSFNHNMKGREWLKELVLEESDDEGEALEMSQKELRVILKARKRERDLRDNVKGDRMRSYHTYYGAGLMSAHDNFNDGTSKSSRNRPVEVNQNALNQIAGSQSAVPSPSPPPAPITVSLADDAPEPLSVDANFSNSAVIPLPPLSH